MARVTLGTKSYGLSYKLSFYNAAGTVDVREKIPVDTYDKKSTNKAMLS